MDSAEATDRTDHHILKWELADNNLLDLLQMCMYFFVLLRDKYMHTGYMLSIHVLKDSNMVHCLRMYIN